MRIPAALQQNLLYALGIVVMKGVSFFMLPVITRYLSPEEFGRLEILNTFGALGSIVVGFGLLNTLFRYYGEQPNHDLQRQCTAEIFGLNMIVAAVTLITGLFFADYLSDWMPTDIDEYAIRLMLTMVAIEGCIAIPLGWLRLNDQATIFFLLNAGKAVLQAALVLLALHFGKGIHGILEAGVAAAALQGLILIGLQLRYSGILFHADRARQILYYSVPLLGSGLLGFVLTGLDRWILADAVGAADLAQYAVAAKFALLSALLLQPFLMWWSPRRFTVLREHGPQKAAYFAAMGSAFSLLIVALVGLTAPLAIELLLPEEYAIAAAYVPWLVLLMAVKDCAELLNLGCYTSESTHAQLGINLIGSLVGVVAMLILIPASGVWGAIVALFMAQGIRLALYLHISQKLLPLPYPSRALLLLAILTVCLLLLGELLDGFGEQLLLAAYGVPLVLALAVYMRLFPSRITVEAP